MHLFCVDNIYYYILIHMFDKTERKMTNFIKSLFKNPIEQAFQLSSLQIFLKKPITALHTSYEA